MSSWGFFEIFQKTFLISDCFFYYRIICQSVITRGFPSQDVGYLENHICKDSIEIGVNGVNKFI